MGEYKVYSHISIFGPGIATTHIVRKIIVTDEPILLTKHGPRTTDQYMVMITFQIKDFNITAMRKQKRLQCAKKSSICITFAQPSSQCASPEPFKTPAPRILSNPRRLYKRQKQRPVQKCFEVSASPYCCESELASFRTKLRLARDSCDKPSSRGRNRGSSFTGESLSVCNANPETSPEEYAYVPQTFARRSHLLFATRKRSPLKSGQFVPSPERTSSSVLIQANTLSIASFPRQKYDALKVLNLAYDEDFEVGNNLRVWTRRNSASVARSDSRRSPIREKRLSGFEDVLECRTIRMTGRHARSMTATAFYLAANRCRIGATMRK